MSLWTVKRQTVYTGVGASQVKLEFGNIPGGRRAVLDVTLGECTTRVYFDGHGEVTASKRLPLGAKGST